MSKYALAIRWRPEILRSLAFGSIGAAYAAVGTAVSNPLSAYKISNDTDVNLIISYDGVNDHEFIASNSFILFDIGSNKSIGDGLFLSKGDRIYVKEESAVVSSGSVYFSAYYASNN